MKRRRPKEMIDRSSMQAPMIVTGRDSDASLCSSRPSSVGFGRSSMVATPITDRAAALRSINAYLSSNSQLLLKPPLPSAKEITETLKFLLHRLNWTPITKLEEDLPIVLKYLGFPGKLNKSAIKAPGTPHSWPAFLAVIDWLVQIARYNDHLTSRCSRFFSEENEILQYALQCYLHFIRGDDDSVDTLDQMYLQKLELQCQSKFESITALEKEIEELGIKLKEMKSGPSKKEKLEKEKTNLIEDSKKFQSIVDTFTSKVFAMQKGLEEKEKELAIKIEESQKICEEIEELKKKIDSQTMNVRDVERMKREIQTVERDIVETETARNSWEEKTWDLDAIIGQKLKEIEGHVTDCNQALRRLKLRTEFQYNLNPNGLTPSQVMGMDYKSTLKPLLAALEKDTKNSSITKLEELINLQQNSRENAMQLEERRSHLAALQSQIEEISVRSNLLKKEMQDHMSKCAAESKRLREGAEEKSHHLDMLEKEANDFVKNSEANLLEARKQSEEQTQLCVQELLALIDAVSKYKEAIEVFVSEISKEASKVVGAIAESFTQMNFVKETENDQDPKENEI